MKTIPEGLAKRAYLICKRFTITGCCDQMYIANVIAHESGIGDGCCNFTGDAPLDNVETIAQRLQFAYSSLIYPEDVIDLITILDAGALEKNLLMRGIKKTIARCKTEKNSLKPDDLRRSYLDHVIQVAQQNVNCVC